MTFCKLFLSPQVYDGMTNMSIICNDVVDEGEWINLWEKNRLIASFDKSTILGWILMGEHDDTPQTEIGYCNECKWFRDKQVCGRCRSKNLFAKADISQEEGNE